MIDIFMHRLADDNEDNAPFQIDYLDLGVQAKQLHRTEPPVDWRALSLGDCILLRDTSELHLGLL